jgi:mannose-6-phosphate isomerase-like protein (cupin superfamily)
LPNLIHTLEATMIIHLADVPEEAQPQRSLVLRRAVNAEDHSQAVSVTWVSIAGHHDRVVNLDSDRVYYILEGGGRFQVGDGAPIEPVTGGDFVLIPRATPYEFEGNLRYLVMNGPAFRPGSDAVLPPQLTNV